MSHINVQASVLQNVIMALYLVLFCFTCNVQEMCFLQKCQKFSCKMFSQYKNLNVPSSLWMCARTCLTKCRKLSYTYVFSMLHNAGKFLTHTVKIYSFLSNAGNIIPAFQPLNTGALFGTSCGCYCCSHYLKTKSKQPLYGHTGTVL